jgi:hypothetical protein
MRVNARRTSVVACIVVVFALVAAAPAWASVAPKLPYTDYSKTGGGSAVDVRSTYYLGVDPAPTSGQKPANIFWANQLALSGTGQAAYFGLQKRSASPNKVAIFSWWGAIDIYCAGVPNVVSCAPFNEQGTGYQALVGFTWQTGVNYTFKLWRGNADVGHSAHWWNLDIFNDAGVRLAPVGAMLVPDSFGGVTSVQQWTEWFGQGSEAADTCGQIPDTDTWFGTPLMDSVAATRTGYGVHYPSAPCWAESVLWNGGSSQRFGV